MCYVADFWIQTFMVSGLGSHPFRGIRSVGNAPLPWSYTAAQRSSFVRTINKFTKAQVANSRWAFFFSPR